MQLIHGIVTPYGAALRKLASQKCQSESITSSGKRVSKTRAIINFRFHILARVKQAVI
jgi:hypothetical protein